MADVTIAASPFELTTFIKQPVVSHTPAGPRDTNLDQTLSLSAQTLTLTVLGTWASIGKTGLLEIELTLDGDFVESNVFNGLNTVTLSLLGDFAVELSRSNWVKWSNIGYLDFTIGKDNIAGEGPMKWSGTALAARKLNSGVVVYGSGGVSLMKPDGYRWGQARLSGVGLHSRLAICGTEHIHFYVDAKHRLCKVSDKVEVLGYDEYIGALSDSLVLSYDEELHRVFICDGQFGYVYSAADKSFCRGPGNITGWAAGGYIAASGTITSIPLEICTDIYDLGSRKDKTFMEVELGINATNPIWVAIDWRTDKTAAFSTTPWTRVNPNARANLPCFGREFRVRVKMLVYEEVKLDYIKVLGQLHNYSFLDSFLRGRQV